jgi:DNA-binding XRE family transcriptional regulator
MSGSAERLNDAWLKDGRTKCLLAQRIGVDRKTLYGILNGDLGGSVTVFARLCAELHVSTDYILYGKEQRYEGKDKSNT